MKDFNGKVVAITGGATGIGFALAKQFGAKGAKIALAGRRMDRLKEAVKELSELNIDAKWFQCDVASRKEMEKFAKNAWKKFGHVDAIVNNAGLMVPNAPVTDTPDEDIDRIFNVNFRGVWNGAAIFGKRFIEQGTEAAIYNIGSENSLFNGVPYGAAYVATKHAVLALTDALREEMPDFVHVSLICPGFVRSELGDPEAMALGMDTDKYAELAMQQILNAEFFVVSHAYNIVRIDARHDEIAQAYERYAPRYEGDQEFDVRTLIAAQQAQGGDDG